jgi:outer membrane protein
LLAAGYDEQVASQKVSDVRGELLPTLKLELVYDSIRDTYVPQTGPYGPKSLIEKSVTLVFSVPLFQPAVYSRISGARHEQSAARYRAKKMELDVTAQVNIAWVSAHKARERVHQFQDVVDASRNALEGVRLEQNAGTRTVQDVLNAERDLLGANISLVGAQHDSAAAEVDLALAIGILTLERLRP